MASNNFAKPPEPLNLEDRAHRGENWKNFKREWSYYEIAAGTATKAEKVRVAALLNVIGRDALDMYETFQWENEADNFKTGKVLERFEERCVPARNEIFERYNFFKRNQNKGESLNAFVRVKLPGKQTWSLAKCVKQVGPRSYEVMCGERIYRRNRRDLRKTAETFADIRETQLKYQYSRIQQADVRKSVSKFSNESPSDESPSEELVLRRSTRVKKLPDRCRAG